MEEASEDKSVFKKMFKRKERKETALCDFCKKAIYDDEKIVNYQGIIIENRKYHKACWKELKKLLGI